jgi:hypothetical protein
MAIRRDTSLAEDMEHLKSLVDSIGDFRVPMYVHLGELEEQVAEFRSKYTKLRALPERDPLESFHTPPKRDEDVVDPL